MNLGTGEEVSNAQLSRMIADEIGFNGEIRWDTTKPNGQPRRRLDTTRATREIGFEPSVTLREGLHRTIEWYLRERVDGSREDTVSLDEFRCRMVRRDGRRATIASEDSRPFPILESV